MNPADLDLLDIKLSDIQTQLGSMDSKEDILLAMLEDVQHKLAAPSVVEPRFPKWAIWLFGSFAGFGILSSIVLIGSILVK